MKVEIVLLIFLGACVAQSIGSPSKNVDCFTEKEKIYWENVAAINKHNSNPNRTYDQEINKFTNLTLKELKPIISGFRQNCTAGDNRKNKTIRVKRDDAELPESLTYESYFSEVKDQGLTCGSCWAFAAVGLVEFRAHSDGNDMIFSEQDVLDCSGGGDCDGGFAEEALDYIIEYGIASEADYPYVEIFQDECMHSNFVEYRPHSIYAYDRTNGDEAFMRKKLYENGPFIATLDTETDPQSLLAYESGVYWSETCTTWISTHSVLVVGYGVDPDYGDYWLVRNSWGSNWGENGYFRIARGVNMCGIEEEMVQLA